MNIFDLLFLVAALATVVCLVIAAALLLLRRRHSAQYLLVAWGIGATIYLATGLTVSRIAPQRLVRVGEPWCFDDWCLAADRLAAGTAPGTYIVKLRLISPAGRVRQRALGAWLFLRDQHGRRYAPVMDPSALPLDTPLDPGQTIRTTRLFELPVGARPTGLITGHGGPYCGWSSVLIIGQGGCLFGRPAIIDLSQ